MEFKLTEDTLQRLEKKENITVRDIRKDAGNSLV